jgi:hypothetical protein
VRRREFSKLLLAAAAEGAALPLKAAAESSLGERQRGQGTSPGGGPVDSATTSSLDVRRFDVAPNNPAAAGANTAALRRLLDPAATGPVGVLIFPNTTGEDVYYFNGVIPIRDGIHIDLMGCTINYSATVTSKDVNSGLFFALRDFTCQNGTITVACDTTAATGSGHAIEIGARGTDSPYFTVWDSQLPTQMGNVRLRNLRINVNNTGTNIAGSTAIGILGGVQDMLAENIVIDGSGTLPSGIYYEFGWATKEAQPHLRHTSHAQNLRFTNITVQNMSSANGIALGLAGAHSCVVDGLHVTSGKSAFVGYPGEAMFYRPWLGPHHSASRNLITLRNVSAESLTSTAVVFTGAQRATASYLAALIANLGHPDAERAQTDLADFSLEGFSIANCQGWGIYSSAGRADIGSGKILGCQRGIVATDECTSLNIDGVEILDCLEHGMQLDIGVAIWNPPRRKNIIIKNCYIAGNSNSVPGRFAGIEIGGNTDSALIENCRFGYEPSYAGVAETTQGDAIFVSSSAATNIVCNANHVGGVAGGSAYHSVAVGRAAPNGNTIERATGLTSSVGNWIKDF